MKIDALDSHKCSIKRFREKKEENDNDIGKMSRDDFEKFYKKFGL